MKTIYLAMTADIIHHGHINIVQKATEYGKVIVGLMTDKAIASYKRVPFLSYHERKRIVENIKGVSKVIPQRTLDYSVNLKKLRPDFVIHGDDWRKGTQKQVREKVIELLKSWGGELIEVPYTKGVSGTELDEAIRQFGTTPGVRRKKLRKLLELKKIVRIIEGSNGLSGLVAEKTKINIDNEVREFDGIWISSFSDSTMKGKPDIELIDLTSRMRTIDEIMEVTTKPVIFDGDTGGLLEHFVFNLKTLERAGVSAIVIEDKIGLKQNSLFGTRVEQIQDAPENFAKKIAGGKKNLVTDDFMIIARIESLILNKGFSDALKRAKMYIDAGADGIMIHSRKKTPFEILEFCKRYNDKIRNKVPLAVVPSTYSVITEDELIKAGVNIVIYANHMLRSVYPAMTKTAESILRNKRAFEAEKDLIPIKDILTLIS